MSSPKCLLEYLNAWENLASDHGRHLPDSHLMIMLKKMLPEKIRVDIKKWLREHPCATVRQVIR